MFPKGGRYGGVPLYVYMYTYRSYINLLYWLFLGVSPVVVSGLEFVAWLGGYTGDDACLISSLTV